MASAAMPTDEPKRKATDTEGESSAPPDTVGASPAPPDAARSIEREQPSSELGRSVEETTDFQTRGTVDPAAPGHRLVAAFGRYVVRGVLGRGGFGVVLLGHDTQLDRAVAIKVLRRSGQNPTTAEQFLQEARRVARLRHPGIVAVHDVGMQEGELYIVADYIDGTSLRQWMVAHRPTWQDAARIVAALADALAHAHAQLTVHRDVKPTNVIMTSDGQPVLVDFGLGIGETEEGRDRGIISGTPHYMSPEQIAGAAHRVDGRTDIYSLGIVLYELLCGRLPFRATSRAELARQVKEDEPQPPRQLVREVPRELERICLKAMAKRVHDRYTTASDLADELRAVLAAARPASAGAPAPLAAPLPSASVTPPVGAGPTTPSACPAPDTARSAATPSSVRRVRDAERRQLTILICGCEQFESEQFLQDLDTEDQAKAVRVLQQACEQVVTRFDGTILQLTEHGVIACFGYPTAHEDAARRAARAALGIRRDVEAISQQIKRQFKLELSPWIGIHTGFAVAEITDTGISVAGEARNIAARLAAFVEPGRILCSGATQQLLGDFFDYESAGTRKVKGIGRPLDLFAVIAERQTASPIELKAPAGLTPLTGRDHEFSLLCDRWDQADEGMGQVVLIIGEPGLGKSRLVYTMKQHVRNQGDDSVVEWRCAPHHQDSGLYPAVEFFERLLAYRHDTPPEERFAKLVEHLQRYDLAQRDTVPLFAALLSLPLDERFPALNLTPVRQKDETLKALQEWLRSYASRRPVLFVVEDLHWIDPSTLEFLRRFVEEGLHDRVLTLLTFRPEFKTPWPAVAHQTSLALNRLTRRQVGEMMERKTGASNIAAVVVQQVYERTGGVPLFVEEYTRIVQEAGGLTAGDDSKVGLDLALHAIPATLQDLIMDRLDRAACNKDVVQLGATLGREFSHEVLAAIAPLDEVALGAELAKLVQADLLYQKGRPPRCTYTFKHALLEDAAYNSMVKSKRQQFHQRVAEVLESRFTEMAENQPETLAHHFTEAGLTRQGIGYWLKAGLRSRERSADLEAIHHLTRGLALIESLEAGPDRDALELQFQAPLGTAYLSTRGYAAPEVGPIFRRARELCEKVGQPPQLFAVMWGTWAWHVVRGDFRLCMDLATEAIALAEKVGDDGITMEALFTPGLTMLYRADFAGAREHCGKAVAQYDNRQRTRLWAAHTGQDSGVTHRCYLALALWHLGFPDQALAVSRELVALARQLAHPFSLCYALHHTSWLMQHCRLGDAAVAAAEETHRIGAEQGYTMWRITGTMYHAGGLVLQGRAAEAISQLHQGLDEYRSAGCGLALPYYLSILGDAFTQTGRFDLAYKALDEALTIAEKNEDLFQEAELHRLIGELALAQSSDNNAIAEARFECALAIARRQQSRAWELRTTLSLARLWRRQGRTADARERLAAAYAWFTEGFGTPDLADAQEMLKAQALET
jgi:serine/threonine protein kinase/predicted ATPase